MASPDLARLIIELLYTVQVLTGYPAPAQIPLVEFVPHAALEEMGCEGQCDIRGLYAGGATIYLDDRLRPETDMWDRSILVHEIVHYYQERAGAFGAHPTCRRWREREGEAYRVQREWQRINPPDSPRPIHARFPRIVVDCDS